MISNAFVDESGQRAFSPKSSDFFVMAAVVLRGQKGLRRAGAVLRQIRQELGRRPVDELKWKNIKSHQQRVRASQIIGGSPFITVSSVVICKRKLVLPHPYWKNDDATYLNTLGMLLKRLSWIGIDHGAAVSYTLAHIVRFKLETLRRYETMLQTTPYEIEWEKLDPKGGAIDRPALNEPLQLADLTTSAVAAAFEPDRFGNTESRYLRELAPRFYRRDGIPLTTSGLKLYPKPRRSPDILAAFPWLRELI